jgi:predicted permease
MESHPVRTFLQDLRYALRHLRRAPLFTVVAVSTLALGIGANTAIFSVVRAVFLGVLPYGKADRLVTVWSDNLPRGWRQFGTSAADLMDFRERSRALDQLSALWTGNGNIAGVDRPARITYAAVSANLFQTLGTEPRLGRGFRAEEDGPGQTGVAVVSDGFWRRVLGSRADAVGHRIVLDGEPLEIVGVMGPGFAFPGQGIELWRPLGLDGAESRGARWLMVVASLAPGRTMTEARTELAGIAERLSLEYPETNRDWTASIEPFQTTLSASRRPAILTAWIAVGLVLLIATANVANLLLARAARRRPEIAIRAALGAARPRLVRQLLTESLVLSVAGAVLGLGLAAVMLPLMEGLAPAGMPGGAPAVLDSWVLGYALVLMGVAGIAFGVLPALRGSRVNLTQAMHGASRGNVSGGSRRMRDLLVVGELVLATVVLLGAGLALRSFAWLLREDPGFLTDHRLSVTVAPARGEIPDRAVAVSYYDRVLGEVGALPGVHRVGAVNVLPVPGGSWWTSSVFPRGASYPEGEEPAAAVRVVAGDYFGAIGIPLLTGRAFSSRDVAESEPVAVIDRTAADRLWPGQDPIGRMLAFNRGGPEEPPVRWYRVIGVAGPVRHVSLDVAPTPMVYTTMSQSQFGHFRDWQMAIVAETGPDPAAMLDVVRRTVAAVRTGTPVFAARTLAELIQANVATRRFTMGLLIAFGGLALVLATIGVYGVMATLVSERTREIGMRMALGATGGRVLRDVVLGGILRAVLGLAIGLVAAGLGSRLLASLTYGIAATDPVTYLLTGTVLLVAALGAAVIPAWRAARLDPMVVLRGE